MWVEVLGEGSFMLRRVAEDGGKGLPSW